MIEIFFGTSICILGDRSSHSGYGIAIEDGYGEDGVVNTQIWYNTRRELAELINSLSKHGYCLLSLDPFQHEGYFDPEGTREGPSEFKYFVNVEIEWSNHGIVNILDNTF